MNPLFTHFGESSSGPSALGINGQAFLIQLGTFIIVFLVLRQWAFKPILKILNNRHDLIEQGVTLGEKMRAEEAAAAEKSTQTLQAARKQADSIVAEAETAGRQKVQAAEETAQKRADGIIAEAKEQIETATMRERERLKREVVELVSDVSEAVIREKVDAAKDAGLIDRALKEREVA